MSADSRLRILADVSHALASTTSDYQALLQKIATTCAQLVGDGCLVTLLDSDGERLLHAANAHRDPTLEVVYRRHVGQLALSMTRSTAISATVLRTGTPVFAPDVDPAELAARSEPQLRPLVTQLDVRSLIVVPIRTHAAVIGTLSVFRTGAGRTYAPEDVVLLQDLADRAGLAIDNARLYRNLEDRVRQRTMELEVFSFAVAHSIRAPLRSIAAFSEALYEDARDRLEPHSRGDLERIRQAVARVRETVDSLLLLAKLADTELRLAPIDITALAHELVHRLRETEPQRTVDVAIEPGIELVGDRRLVELALSMLMSNAWQSTRGRGDARVSLALDRSAAPPALVLHDNGGLLPGNARALLADHSRSQPRPVGDFGLGLVIARQVIHQHGGTISIDEGTVAGTTVRCTLAR